MYNRQVTQSVKAELKINHSRSFLYYILVDFFYYFFDALCMVSRQIASC